MPSGYLNGIVDRTDYTRSTLLRKSAELALLEFETRTLQHRRHAGSQRGSLPAEVPPTTVMLHDQGHRQ